MLKYMLPILAALTGAMKWTTQPLPTATPRGSTKGIPSHNPYARTRAHAPNDGRWRMKFHRGRIHK